MSLLRPVLALVRLPAEALQALAYSFPWISGTSTVVDQVDNRSDRQLQPGRCLLLNGTTQYGRDATLLTPIGTSDFTTSVWFKSTRGSGTSEFLQACYGGGGAAGWDTYIDSVTNAIKTRTESAANTAAGVIIVNDGQWHHTICSEPEAETSICTLMVR